MAGSSAANLPVQDDWIVRRFEEIDQWRRELQPSVAKTVEDQVRQLREANEYAVLPSTHFEADGTSHIADVIHSTERPSWANAALISSLTLGDTSGNVGSSGGPEMTIEFRHGTPAKYAQELGGVGWLTIAPVSYRFVQVAGGIIDPSQSMTQSPLIDLRSDATLECWTRIDGDAGTETYVDVALGITWLALPVDSFP